VKTFSLHSSQRLFGSGHLVGSQHKALVLVPHLVRVFGRPVCKVIPSHPRVNAPGGHLKFVARPYYAFDYTDTAIQSSLLFARWRGARSCRLRTTIRQWRETIPHLCFSNMTMISLHMINLRAPSALHWIKSHGQKQIANSSLYLCGGRSVGGTHMPNFSVLL